MRTHARWTPAWLVGALILGARAGAEITLDDSGWSTDQTYLMQVADLDQQARERGSASIVSFGRASPIELVATEQVFPTFELDVRVTTDDPRVRIRRDSLKVTVARGFISKNITKDVLQYVTPRTCDFGLCELLEFRDQVNLQDHGTGNYTFIVDVEDERGFRHIGKLSVAIRRA